MDFELTLIRFTGIRRTRYYVNPATQRVVNLIMTNYESATATLLFHSTVVMNFVTWDALFCLYPRMLRDGVGLANSDRMDRRSFCEGPLQKYRSRGFRILRSAHEWMPEHICGISGYCGLTERSIFDDATMYIQLSNSVGMPVNSVSRNIAWKLATSHACGDSADGADGADYVASTPGWVKTGSGVRLGECDLFVECLISRY